MFQIYFQSPFDPGNSYLASDYIYKRRSAAAKRAEAFAAQHGAQWVFEVRSVVV